jgi:hypothetical protein
MPSKNTSKNTSKKTEQKNYSQMENGDILQTNINEEYLANMPLHKLRKLINKYNDNNNGNKIGATLSKHKFLKKMLKKEGIKQKSHTICCPICSKTNQILNYLNVEVVNLLIIVVKNIKNKIGIIINPLVNI